MQNQDSPTVIIVLGHLMHKNGSLNEETRRRVELAAHADKEVAAEAIILCGWAYRADSDITIASAMKEHIAQSHPALLPKAMIQDLSRDTVGDAFFSRLLLYNVCREKQPDVIVVTSDYHVDRSKLIFEFIFHGYAKSINVQGCRLIRENDSKQLSELNSIAAFKETFLGICNGDMKGIHNAMRSSHPFYNGTVYPVISSPELIASQLRLLGSIT